MNKLSSGGHQRPEDGTCVMEYISLLTSDEFSDFPRCTEPAVAVNAQRTNDGLDDDDRQGLHRLVKRIMAARPLPGTREQVDAEFERLMAYYRTPDDLGLLLSKPNLRQVRRDAYSSVAEKHQQMYRYPNIYNAGIAPASRIEWLERILDHHDKLLHNFARAEAMSRALRGESAPENIGTCAACLEPEEVQS